MTHAAEASPASSPGGGAPSAVVLGLLAPGHPRPGHDAASYLFFSTLGVVCDRCPPVFATASYGERFRALAGNPAWLLLALVANVTAQRERATEMWRMLGRVPDRMRPGLTDCVVAKSTQPAMYLTVLESTFPKAVDDDLLVTLRRLCETEPPDRWPPQPSAPESRIDTLDAVVGSAIREMRTYVGQRLLEPVARAYAPPAAQADLARVTDRLLSGQLALVHLLAAEAGRVTAGDADSDALLAAAIERHLVEMNNDCERDRGVEAPGPKGGYFA